MVRKLNSKNNLKPTLVHPQLYIDFYFYFTFRISEMWWIRIIFSWKILLKGWNCIFLVEKWKYCQEKQKKLLHLSGPMPSNNPETSRREPSVFRGCLTERSSRRFCIMESEIFHVRWYEPSVVMQGKEQGNLRLPRPQFTASQCFPLYLIPCWPALLPLHVSKLFSTLSFRWQLTLDMSLDGW